jgi:hypothetical protein
MKINETETKRTIWRIKEIKSWLLEKISNVDYSSTKLTKREIDLNNSKVG